MRVHLVLAICAATLSGTLSGCGYYRDPGSEILVETEPSGAACVLTRQGAPIAEVNPTPAIALVSRSPAEIVISCRRPGFFDAASVTTSADISGPFESTRFEYGSPVRIPMRPR